MNIRESVFIGGVVLLVCGMLLIASSPKQNSNLETIQADINYKISIEYNGEGQAFYDKNGNQVFPISYRGTTYVPIREISDMFGADVEYDARNYTIIIMDREQATPTE